MNLRAQRPNPPMMSYQTERNVDSVAPRWPARYRCPKGRTVEVALSVDAQASLGWTCPHHSTTATLIGSEPPPLRTSPSRTHWGMLREGRIISELEQLLIEQLEKLRTRNATRAPDRKAARDEQAPPYPPFWAPPLGTF